MTILHINNLKYTLLNIETASNICYHPDRRTSAAFTEFTEEIMKKKPFLPAASAFLLMIAMSSLSTALSFFVTPVCEELGFGRGSFSFYTSLITATGAVSASYLANYMTSRGTRGVVLLSAVWCGLGFWGMSMANALWMFYLLGAAMGFLSGTCLYLAGNVIVQQSYEPKDVSMVWGIVMAGCGIGGVIWSNVVPLMMGSFGWRFSYRALAILWFSLAAVSTLLLKKPQNPDSMGTPKNVPRGGSKKDIFTNPKFYLTATAHTIFTAGSCIASQLPAILSGLGYGSEQVGLMISVMTAAGAVGTIAEGVLCSSWGIKRTMGSMMILYIAGFLLLWLDIMPYVALVCLAFGSGICGTLMPVMVRVVFGGRDYAAVWAYMIVVSSISGFVSNPLWGMVYDIFGTYSPALIAMAAMLLGSIFAVQASFRDT